MFLEGNYIRISTVVPVNDGNLRFLVGVYNGSRKASDIRLYVDRSVMATNALTILKNVAPVNRAVPKRQHHN